MMCDTNNGAESGGKKCVSRQILYAETLRAEGDDMSRH